MKRIAVAALVIAMSVSGCASNAKRELETETEPETEDIIDTYQYGEHQFGELKTETIIDEFGFPPKMPEHYDESADSFRYTGEYFGHLSSITFSYKDDHLDYVLINFIEETNNLEELFAIFEDIHDQLEIEYGESFSLGGWWTNEDSPYKDGLAPNLEAVEAGDMYLSYSWPYAGDGSLLFVSLQKPSLLGGLSIGFAAA